jgi:spore coat protein SA
MTRFKNPELLYVYKVAKWIKKLNIKIAHVRNRPLYIPYLRELLGRDVKLIIHEHNQNIADTLSQNSALDVLDAVDAYVGVSKFTMDYEITKRYSQFSNKAHYILNGVHIDKFGPIWERQAEAEQLRAKYKLGNSKVILFIGAIRERKGIHFLVRAMKEVIKKHPEAKLVVVGGSAKNIEATDPFAKMVRDEAKELGNNVLFLGFVPSTDIRQTYLLADIFAGPSTWDEPFGLVFAEASATGLPVVTSKRGGIPEIIRDNVSGLLVDDPSNTADLAEKINCLLDNPEIARKFGEAGRKIMADRFSWDRVANEIENLYDKLIKA